MYKSKVKFLGKHIVDSDNQSIYKEPYDNAIIQEVEDHYIEYKESEPENVCIISKHQLAEFLEDFEIIENVYENKLHTPILQS